MKEDIEILETKLYILKKVNKVCKGKFDKEIMKIEKKIIELKK